MHVFMLLCRQSQCALELSENLLPSTEIGPQWRAANSEGCHTGLDISRQMFFASRMLGAGERLRTRFMIRKDCCSESGGAVALCAPAGPKGVTGRTIEACF